MSRIWKQLQTREAADSATETEVTVDLDPSSAIPKPVEPAATELPTPEPEENAASAPYPGDVACEEEGSEKKTTRAKRERMGAPREGSKADTIIALLKREGGASLREMMDATGWQKYSVRGFLAGTINKKMQLNLTSSKNEAGERRYSIS